MIEQKCILLVEDDQHQAAMTEQRLKAMGYQVIGPVDNGEDAERLAEEQHPDLVLMDIILLGPIDGIDAARRIGRLSIPVIYLTSNVNMDILERAKLTEPLGFLVKPFTDRELQATVMMAIYRSDMEHQLAEFRMVVDQAHNDSDVEKKLLLSLLNNYPGMVFHRGKGQQIGFDYLSAGAQRLTGYTLDQLRTGDIDFYSLIATQDRERVSAEHNSVRQGGKYQVDYQLTNADNQTYHLRETGFGILDKEGNFSAIEAYISIKF